MKKMVLRVKTLDRGQVVWEYQTVVILRDFLPPFYTKVSRKENVEDYMAAFSSKNPEIPF